MEILIAPSESRGAHGGTSPPMWTVPLRKAMEIFISQDENSPCGKCHKAQEEVDAFLREKSLAKKSHKKVGD